jgi:hypothetical protein
VNLLLARVAPIALVLVVACSTRAEVAPVRLEIVDEHGSRSTAVSVDELVEAVGFDVALPDSLPGGYSYDSLSAMVHVGDGADFRPPPGSGSSLLGVLRGGSPSQSAMILVRSSPSSGEAVPGEIARLGGADGILWERPASATSSAQALPASAAFTWVACGSLSYSLQWLGAGAVDFDTIGSLVSAFNEECG